ncbi:small integral membrane protein 12 [Copidosoma floridanum]|uniref:small integral membrane protein 12 n=1 Tax=Copidosoma floridanum TaxID=29053 RepID=UPI0006C95AF1|nr:small integral membrane protein 12 [Copidosoma floridanum]XP_014212368.1 small integral membrane protein 12 [Copidosoma floridanum]XP_014212369.1 small integral membrane protein 12 [Copidosoma floridanum]
MWPIFMGLLRRYTPYITLPFAAVVGFAGYHIEGWISDRYTPASPPISQKRQERLLENIDSSTTRQKHNPLEVNLSPSLSS